MNAGRPANPQPLARILPSFSTGSLCYLNEDSTWYRFQGKADVVVAPVCYRVNEDGSLYCYCPEAGQPAQPFLTHQPKPRR